MIAKFTRMILLVYNLSLLLIDLVQFVWRATLLTIQAFIQLILRPTKKSLAGEVVLITGAGHGLGRELALEFTRRGATKVVVWDINEESCEQTAAEVKKLGGKAFSYHCDVSNREEVKAMAQHVFEDVGVVTTIVNNAGIMPVQPFTCLNHQQIKRVMEVNTMAHFWTIYEFLPKMMDVGRGHVVAISSVAGRLGTPNLLPYVTSKFAVTGMMECLHEELRYSKLYPDVHMTTVFPFFLTTGFCKNPRVKYPWLSPVTDPDVAAKKIIDGIQRNAEHVYIPATFEYFHRFSQIFPRSVQHLFVDFFDSGANPQED